MSVLVIRGDARDLPLPDASVDLIVTSPPYFGLRSYTDGGEHYDGQIGSEATPGEYVTALVACTAEWVRVLKPAGSLFVNLGDKYASAPSGPMGTSSGTSPAHNSARTANARQRITAGVPEKSLLGLPWRYALAATDQLGLILRAEIIWAKPNGLPESVTDRVRRAHELVFHFTRQPRYYSAVDEIREPHEGTSWATAKRLRVGTEQQGPKFADRVAANTGAVRGDAMNPLGKLPGSVWDIPSQPLTVPPRLGVDHFAAFPMELPRRIIAGWSPPGVCTACGEGRRPVADRRYVKRDNGRPVRVATYTDNNFGGTSPLMRNGTGYTTVAITGYTCACPRPDAPARPAVILDPFGGTGTTALLAHALGRHGITIDRSADYCRLAAWRTTDPAELARALEVPKPPPVPEGMDMLF